MKLLTFIVLIAFSSPVFAGEGSHGGGPRITARFLNIPTKLISESSQYLDLSNEEITLGNRTIIPTEMISDLRMKNEDILSFEAFEKKFKYNFDLSNVQDIQLRNGDIFDFVNN
ncbi:hypothetical protein A9Q84_00015 [Halobacteriovorax marinus]|uniref:Uncharacterized protein n=1 Tax=Halobacteriovorax marinus TaxID=97084 RepID=A0A1Y5FD53_9BACT|nr:hypothetical protein A9Q84_00015 [Halobacteriovorax marinus]